MKLTAQSNNRELIWHEAKSNVELMKMVKEEINSHPTKQTIKQGSCDIPHCVSDYACRQDEVKTDDIIMTGCPDEMEELYK